MYVATTGAPVKAAWLVAILTLYWQEALMSTSIQKGQGLTAPLARVVVVWIAEFPPVYFTQYKVPGFPAPLLKT